MKLKSFIVDPEDWVKFKRLAADNYQSASARIRQLIREDLEKCLKKTRSTRTGN